jgi:hypothetical protein
MKKGLRNRKYRSCDLVFDPNKLLLTSYVISIFTPNLSNVKLKLPANPIGIQDLIGCVNSIKSQEKIKKNPKTLRWKF